MAAVFWLFAVAIAASASRSHAGQSATDSTSASSSAATDDADSLLFAPDSTLEDAEPPAEAAPGEDFEDERGDSLASGIVELGYGLSGRASSAIRRRQRVRVREDGLEAHVREGSGDALSGAGLGTRFLGGRLAVGRASPRWARGLMVGTPREPWRAGGLAAEAAESRAGASEGFEYSRPGPTAFALIAARARRDAFAGASVGSRRAGLGVVLSRGAASRRTRSLAALWIAGADASGELALDARGRWRAEGAWAPGGDERLAIGARFGHIAYEGAAPLAAARPAAALTVASHGIRGPLSASISAATWRFGAGAAGALGMLEVRAVLPQHDVLALGFEERHGVRRFEDRAPPPGTFRQGVWAGWSGGPPRLAMSVRHELWSRRGAFGEPVRRVASVNVSTRTGRGIECGLSVALFRVRAGEPQYVSEIESDRRVLRALSGAGRRTRLQCVFPAAAGSVRAALTLPEAAGRVSPPQWTLDWTRRVRPR